MSDMLLPEVAALSTSLAKNLFPSIGTIMIWTLSERRSAGIPAQDDRGGDEH